MKNLVITGRSGRGKSHLIRQLITDYHLDVAGFTSSLAQYTGATKRYHLHSLQAIEGNDPCIIEATGAEKILFPGVFDDFGVRILASVDAPIVVMDELGGIEQEALTFQAKVLELWLKDQILLSVWKKAEIPWLKRLILEQEDCFLDLDVMSYPEAYAHAGAWLERWAMVPSKKEERKKD